LKEIAIMGLTKEDLENVSVVVARTVLEALRTPPPPQNPNIANAQHLRMARGLDRPPPAPHTTAFSGSIVDPTTSSTLRVTGKITFQQWRTSLGGPDGDGKGPLIWRCIELPEDNLSSEEGDLRKLFDKEFAEKNRDDISRAAEDPERAAHLRALHAKEFRICVFNRGRRPLHNAMLGKSAEQVAPIVTLADPPPAIDNQPPPPETAPVPAPVSGESPLAAILHGP
jgi:hypothetical protein